MNRPSRQHLSLILLVITLLLLLNACSALQLPNYGNPEVETNSAQSTITLTPFQPLSAADTAAPAVDVVDVPTATLPPPSPTPETTPLTANPSQSFWIDPFLPSSLANQINIPPGIEQVVEPANAALRLTVNEESPSIHWIYALVAPYPTITAQVTKRDLKQSWQGNPSGPFAGKPILMDEKTHGVLSEWWGEPAPSAAQIIPPADLIETAWNQQR